MLKYQLEDSGVFHALADPSRRHMVEQLSRGPATVSELAAPLPMSLPAAVQHLAVLEASGLVRSQKVGRVRTCQLHPVAMRTAEDWMAARRAEWEQRLDRLGAYLAAQDGPAEAGHPPEQAPPGTKPMSDSDNPNSDNLNSDNLNSDKEK